MMVGTAQRRGLLNSGASLVVGKTLRLWDLNTFKSKQVFSGHTNEEHEVQAVEAEKLEHTQDSANSAINKVKENVVKLKTSARVQKEVAKKKEIAAVRHIAGKAALAVNAANLATALHKQSNPIATAASPSGAASPPTPSNQVKMTLKSKMAKSKAIAEKAAHQWRIDAHKLADVETERSEKSRQRLEEVKENARQKMEAAEATLDKQKNVYKKISGQEESMEVKAKRSAKLSRMVTDTFNKHPKLDSDAENKIVAVKAEQKAKHATEKAKGLLVKAKAEATKANQEKSKAKEATNSALVKAHAAKRAAQEKVSKADEQIAQAKTVQDSAASAAGDFPTPTRTQL